MRRNPVYQNSPRLFYQESHLNNILGTLVREGESLDRRFNSVDQLREWLKQVDPVKINPKMVPKITYSICRAFAWRHKELRNELAECLRLMGRNLGDFVPMFFFNLRIYIDSNVQNPELSRFNSQFGNSPELSDEEKGQILKSLIEVFTFYSSSRPEILPAVLPELTFLLSRSTVADIYIPVLMMIGTMLPQYAEIFVPYFTDVADVCIGWYISTAQRRDTVRRETEKVLLNLHPVCAMNPVVVIDFLMQFSEDLEKNLLDMKTKEEPQPDTLDKVYALFDVCYKNPA